MLTDMMFQEFESYPLGGYTALFLRDHREKQLRGQRDLRGNKFELYHQYDPQEVISCL